MLYSLLFRLPILENSEYKYIILVIIASILYVVLHYVLFSKFLNINFIHKFKYIIYAIFLVDIIFAKRFYDNKITTTINKKKQLYEYKQYEKEYPLHSYEVDSKNTIGQNTIKKNYLEDNVHLESNIKTISQPIIKSDNTNITLKQNNTNTILEQDNTNIILEQNQNNLETIQKNIKTEQKKPSDLLNKDIVIEYVEIPLYQKSKSNVKIEQIEDSEIPLDKLSNIVISDDEIILTDIETDNETNINTKQTTID